MEDYTGKYKGEQVEVALFGGEGARLLASGLVERLIGMALKAPFAVPVRLAVSNEQQLGHFVLG